MFAATPAATPIFALSKIETSPTDTLTSPFCCELFAAAAGPAMPTPSTAVAAIAADIFLIDRKIASLLSCPHAAGDRRASLASGSVPVDWPVKPRRKIGRLNHRERVSLPRTRDTEEAPAGHRNSGAATHDGHGYIARAGVAVALVAHAASAGALVKSQGFAAHQRVTKRVGGCPAR